MLDIVENKHMRDENLTIHTFGSTAAIQNKYPVHQITLESNTGREKIILEAIAMKFMARATKPRSETEVLPQGGELADRRKPNDHRAEFDIIIGCDN